MELELSEFGVPKDVERAYYDLRDHGPATASSLEVWLPRGLDAHTMLTSLESFGMATRGQDGRWAAEEWKSAVEHVSERFIEQQQSRLRELMAADKPPEPFNTALVGQLTGSVQINRYLNQRMSDAKESVRAFDLPPYMNVRDDPSLMNKEGLEEIAAEWDPVTRGVKTQGVYHPSGYRNNPTKIAEITAFIEAGEEARWNEGIGTKLIIIDRTEALIGLRETYAGPPENVRAMRTDHPIILEALNSQFDAVWEEATPWRPPPDKKADPSDKQEFVYQCLLSGMTDKVAIGRMMSLGPQQAGRYIQAVMEDLGADDQIQLGMRLQAMRDNWESP